MPPLCRRPARRASSNRFQVARNRISVYPGDMLTLPIPMVVALILGFLTLRSALAGDRPALFLALMGACALQAGLISLIQHYGADALRPVQPVTASLIPPLAWVTFQGAAIRPLEPGRDGLHLVVPGFVAFCVAFAPGTLDAVLPVIFLAYGGALLWRLRGEGPLPLARLESGGVPARIWRAVAAMLLLSALSDVLIAVALGLGQAGLRPLIVSLFSSLTLLAIGLLSLSREAGGAADGPDAAPPPDTPTEEEGALVARLDRLMADERPFLDPDLTLTRLARRLHVPIKQLSAAINRAKGENVSRYVNGFRIRHACDRLAAGDSVTEAMLGSGFATKSNFNREFARVTGQSPTDWHRSRGPA